MAVLKRLKFAATSERFASTLAPEQKSLLEETLDADLAELDVEIERERGEAGDKDKTEKKTPKRAPLPPHLPRRDVAHEPTDTTCGCGQPMQRIGQDVAEKLDYQPGVFTVERHVRGKWACRCCQKVVSRRRCRRTSSTRASPRPACWRRCWWPSSWTTCRCTARSTSSSAPAT
jgi:transposase